MSAIGRVSGRLVGNTLLVATAAPFPGRWRSERTCPEVRVGDVVSDHSRSTTTSA